MARPLLIEGMRGLGDNLYQRPFVRAAAAQVETFLVTPWPEIYEDIPGLSFVDRPARLRTQEKNRRRQLPGRWSPAPRGARPLRVGYGARELPRLGLVGALAAAFRAAGIECAAPVWDLPPLPPSGLAEGARGRPIAVVRPATVRAEWSNPARNPRPEYLAAAAADLAERYAVVSVADLRPGHEWALDPLPPAATVLHRGELPVARLLALVAEAALVVGGIGWLLPAAIAAGTPGFFVLGGQLAHNAPEIVTDGRMDTSRLGFARPARPCRCADMRHECDREIPDFAAQWRAWRDAHAL
jgi:hypothetical protein